MMHMILSEQASRILLLMMTVVVVAAGLYFAQPVLAPAVLGVVLGIVVSPLADKLTKYRVPRVVTAAGLLLLTIAAISFLLVSLEPLIWRLAVRIPVIMEEVRGWMNEMAGIFRGIETISSEIEKTVGEGEGGGESALPTVMDAIWMAPNFGAQALIFAGTFFFFVFTRHDLYRNAGSLQPTLARADRAVARYFAAVMLVNAGLGFATATALGIEGLNGSILWGLAATILNFVFYLGPALMVGGLFIAGLIQFDGAMSFVPPLTFLLFNLIESQFVTPTVVGQRLNINPLVVFLAIVFGLWIWGPLGAIVALPVLVWLEVLLTPEDQIPVRRSFRQRLRRPVVMSATTMPPPSETKLPD
ncbi:Predicted PurR-regulated permease PerM [Poseidonocella pacifica]|uniref:Predicted PurR-regulated permease PerM n=1 Tax=Poseidonocella pacifica TaxID=871651 RepID=A0A1I0YEW4_9RHOB|nr:AI-2E family transporter [Poseidonocella pacifica]SFB11296.1 Predicted PurR-regulated permease PerM [Poseidonocella pacifica]